MQTDTQDTTYNGWKNYATWGVSLVLDNDEGTQGYIAERIRELKAEASDHRNVPEIWTEEQAVRYELQEFLEEITEELCGLGQDGLSLMAQQMITTGLCDVDWNEIATNMLSES